MRRRPGVRRQALRAGRRVEHDRTRSGPLGHRPQDRRRMARGRIGPSLGALPRGRRRPAGAGGHARRRAPGGGAGRVHRGAPAGHPRGLARSTSPWPSTSARCPSPRAPATPGGWPSTATPTPTGSWASPPVRHWSGTDRPGAAPGPEPRGHRGARTTTSPMTTYDRPFGRYFEDFEPGDVYRHWPGKTITEADDHLFCMITMNHHPLHTNAWLPSTRPSRGRNVVVGNLVYSLVLGLSVPDVSGMAIANLEVESLIHRAPTFHGDTIYAETKVIGKVESKSRDDRGVVTVEIEGVQPARRRGVLLPPQGHGVEEGRRPAPPAPLRRTTSGIEPRSVADRSPRPRSVPWDGPSSSGGRGPAAGSRRPDLPWRSTRDPWAVLVSEIMAQQTQLARVVAGLPALPGLVPHSCGLRGGAARRGAPGLAGPRLQPAGGQSAPGGGGDGGRPRWSGPRRSRRSPGTARRGFLHGPGRPRLRLRSRCRGGGHQRREGPVAGGRRSAPCGSGRPRTWWTPWSRPGSELGVRAGPARPGGGGVRGRRPALPGVPGPPPVPMVGDGDGRLPIRPRGSAGVSAPQSTFAGSDRQGRGRLVDALRRARSGPTGWPRPPGGPTIPTGPAGWPPDWSRTGWRVRDRAGTLRLP